MKLSQVIVGILGSLWLLAICIGLPILMKYEYTPGKAAVPPKLWPKDSQLHLASDRATLVMVAHSQCPCTKASIDELAELAARRGSKLKIYVLFLSPDSVPADWNKKDLFISAQAIPGVIVLKDAEGREAKKFNSVTSGQTLVYSPQKDLLFAGGITPARGQIGDNFGLDTIIKTLDGRAPILKAPPVFGCPLINPHK